MGSEIQNVETIGLRAPPDEPFGYAQAWVETRSALLVRIETKDGAVGWGECWGPIAGTRETVDNLLAPEIEGRDPSNVERISEDLYDSTRAAYQSTVPLPALSGVDLALWDLKGKQLGVPVSDLLGGRRRDGVRAYGTGHYFKYDADLDEQFERISAEAEENAEQLGAIKVKIGLDLLGYGWEADLELVERVREAVGPKTDLMVDANYAYDTATARTVGRQLTDLDIRWFEEPVAPENIEGYGHLREALDVPVAGGECHTPDEFDRLFDAGGLDIAQPDVCAVGGLTAAARVADRAHAEGVNLVPHVWGTPVTIAASLQLIAALPDHPWLEFDRSSNPLREELAAEPFTADDGQVAVPDGPGLGVELDRKAVERYRTV